jgi:hypothetical protein
MIEMIPFVTNDYLLTALYVVIIAVLLWHKRRKNDLVVLMLGFVIMLCLESIFVLTGVETFSRQTLFGLMPLWLPVLWGYGFVSIKRVVEAL